MDLDVLVCQRYEDVGEESGRGDSPGDESIVVRGSGGCIEGGEEVGKEVGGERGYAEASGW